MTRHRAGASLGVWTCLSLKQLVRSRFYVILALVQPLFFLTVTALLSRGQDRALGEALAGTTVMGMWSATLFGAGRALQRERRAGTMEFWLVAPVTLLPPLLAVCLGAAALGVASAGAGLAGAVLLYGYTAGPSELALFGLTLLAGIPGIALLGLLMSGVFVLVRQASMLTNMLEYPVWFACALVVAPESRPRAVTWVGELLAPTHVGELLRGALTAGDVEAAAAGKLVVLSVLYLVAARSSLRRVEQIVRRRGDLAMA